MASIKRFVVVFGLTLTLLSCFSLLPATSASHSVAPNLAESDQLQKQRGVSWVGSGEPVTREDFAPLLENHVNWIVQTPFGWQEDFYTPHVALETTGDYWGGTDIGLAKTTELAQSFGIHTLLKPHLWLTHPQYGLWRTEIEMYSEADWQTWFDSYSRFILHYAEFAEAHQIESFCVGTELQTTAVLREQDWRQLIAKVREVYHGKLTYAANWDRAFEEIQFWDALDFIGIQAYFPLSHSETPHLETLKSAWEYYLPGLEQVQTRYQKPIIFTELGYRSTDDAALDPWKWPADSELDPQEWATASGLETQANCYEAFFQTVWQKDWFAGMYVWKWFPELKRSPNLPPSEDTSLRVGKGFSPQNKPAEQVLRKWYGLS